MSEAIRAHSALASVLAVITVGPAFAQAPAFDISYGAWKTDNVAIIWSAGYRQLFVGPIDYSVGLTHVDDHQSPLDRTQTGAGVSVGVLRDGSGPYGVAGVGLGMKHYDGNLDASWSVGAGWALRALPFLSVGLEALYRAEDQFSKGFWNLDPTDRRGVSIMARVRLGSIPGGRSGGGTAQPRPPQFDPPSTREIERSARAAGASRAGSEIAADVVGTALEVMGTPYRWGGDGSNGYDCSGLIQYAYGQHGIILPRISREQARLGITVDQRIESLQAGDILGFSVEGAGVSHVGLYIGEGQFIHSATAGVKLSSLTATDPDSIWWKRRWIQSRRILQ